MSAVRHDLSSRVLELLEALPANQREVVRLKFQNGFSYQEISRISGHSVSNVGYLIHAGIKALRVQLFARPGGREPTRKRGDLAMTIDPNDPRLTAFVLGELDPTRMRGHRGHAGRVSRMPPGRRRDPSDGPWLSEQLHEESRSHAPAAGLNHQLIAECGCARLAPPSWWKRNRSSIIGLAALLMLGATICFVTVVPSPPDK